MREIPRRNDLQRLTPAEDVILQAMRAVESLPADVRLTDAVTLLGAARESVADYVDGVPRVERYVHVSRIAELLDAHRKVLIGAGELAVDRDRVQAEVGALVGLFAKVPELVRRAVENHCVHVEGCGVHPGMERCLCDDILDDFQKDFDALFTDPGREGRGA